MIIAEQKGFAFIHIPKCAGSLIHQRLGPLDTSGGAFTRVKQHSALGRVHLRHLRLKELRDHFPDEYAAVERLRTFAVVRDPASRFSSAVSEYVKSILKSDILDLGERELAGVIDGICDKLGDPDIVVDARYCIFARQVDYVDLAGRRIVSDPYPMEHLPSMMRELGALSGIEMSPDERANQSVRLRLPAARGAAQRLNRVGRRLLPVAAYHRLKKLASPLLVRPEPSHSGRKEFHAPRVQAFLERFYADDFILHQERLEKVRPLPRTAAQA